MTVLDASAVLALLQDEPGADIVEDAIDDDAIISAANLAEVLTKMVDAGADVERATDLVLARSRDLPLITADRAWSALAEPLGVTVHAIR